MNRIWFTLLFILIRLNLFSQMMPGKTFTDLTLPDVNGKMVSTADLKGRVILIDFWASWCGPCRHNNPKLVKLYDKYHNQGLEIYGVSLDDNENSWKKAVRHDKIKWIQVIDENGWESSSARIYGVDMIPSSFLIDRYGIIRAINAEGADLENSVRDLLKN